MKTFKVLIINTKKIEPKCKIPMCKMDCNLVWTATCQLEIYYHLIPFAINWKQGGEMGVSNGEGVS